MQNKCMNCDEPLINFLCDECRTKQLAFWIKEIGGHSDIVISNMAAQIGKTVVGTEKSEIPCIVCKQNNVSQCIDCYLENIKKILYFYLPQDIGDRMLWMMTYQSHNSMFHGRLQTNANQKSRM